MTTCLYCGGALPKHRRKYCSTRCSIRYSQEYLEPFWWNNARAVALQRANHRCEECGSETGIEVHHVTPLGPREPRHMSPKNTQSNLIVLCRDHHEQAHHPAKSQWNISIGEAHRQLPLEAL